MKSNEVSITQLSDFQRVFQHSSQRKRIPILTCKAISIDHSTPTNVAGCLSPGIDALLYSHVV